MARINETWINDEGLFVKVRVQGEDIAMLVDTLLRVKNLLKVYQVL